LTAASYETSRHSGSQQAEQALDKVGVERRLGLLEKSLAVEQFGFLRDEAQVVQRMVSLDAQRPNLRATDD
jgi:hypothetical protein